MKREAHLRRHGFNAVALALLSVACSEHRAEQPTERALPRRIVSLTPSLTEIAFAVGASPQIVGVTKYCNYPEQAKSRPIVGGTTSQTISLETILRLEPDLVLAGGFGQDDVVAALRREHIRVERHHPGSITDTFETILAVGHAVGKSARAQRIVTSLRDSIEAARAKANRLSTARTRIFYLVWDDPLITVGAETFIGEIIEAAGGENIFNDLAKDFPRVGVETVVRRKPNMVMMPSHHGGSSDTAKTRAERAGIGELVEHVRYAIVDGDVISRPGPRVAEAVEMMAGAIHGTAWKRLQEPSL